MHTQKVQEVSNEQVKAIQSIANEIPGSLDLFEYMSARIRGRQDFSFKRVIRVMREHGRNITKDQLQTICEKLQSIGVGRIEYGKNGKDNRFIVAFHLISIAKAAKGEIAELDPVGKQKVVLPHLALVKTAEEQKATELQPAPIEQKKPRMILVRCGAFEMELPLNMTAEERESASDLIASMPQVYQN
jgi:hypothetical protein